METKSNPVHRVVLHPLLLTFVVVYVAIGDERKPETRGAAALPQPTNQFDPPLGITGTVRKHEGFASRFVAPRNVHVWLPPSYETNSSGRYAVIYAMDGQNQFDPKLSFIGVDWALDETMTRLIAA